MSIVRVAAKAGVSLATVSRVINRRPGVSAEMRKAVREAMTLLGYKPPPPEQRPGPRISGRRPTSTRPLGTIAIVLLDEVYQYSPGLCLASLRGVQREAADHGWQTVTIFAQSEQLLQSSLRSGIEGLVLMGSHAPAKTLNWLRRVPHVWLTSHHDASGASALEGNHEIARLACDYLIGRGHRHLAFIAVTSSYPAFDARSKSMQFFAASHGASVKVLMDDDHDPSHPLPDFAQLQQRMDLLVDRLVSAAPRPTGLFVGNDAMAAMCYRSLRARGLEPGRDVDVISCNNDTAILLGLQPRPTTIDLGSELLGRRSVEQLLRTIRRPDETRHVRIAISPVLIEADHHSETFGNGRRSLHVSSQD